MFGIEVALHVLHCSRIRLDTPSHKPIPRHLVLLCFSRRERMKGYKEWSRREQTYRFSSGTYWLVSERWVGYPRRGVKRSVNNVNMSNETY